MISIRNRQVKKTADESTAAPRPLPGPPASRRSSMEVRGKTGRPDRSSGGVRGGAAAGVRAAVELGTPADVQEEKRRLFAAPTGARGARRIHPLLWRSDNRVKLLWSPRRTDPAGGRDVVDDRCAKPSRRPTEWSVHRQLHRECYVAPDSSMGCATGTVRIKTSGRITGNFPFGKSFTFRVITKSIWFSRAQVNWTVSSRSRVSSAIAVSIMTSVTGNKETIFFNCRTNFNASFFPFKEEAR